MRFRATASLMLGLAALTSAFVTTISNGSAGAGRQAGAPPSSLSTTGVSTDAGTGPPLCRVRDEVERLTVNRTDALPQNGSTFSFPARVTIRSTAVTQARAQAACALPPVPATKVLNCPADFGIVYDLIFTRETGGAVEPVTADATGCQFLKGADPGTQAMFTSDVFWAKLGRAIGLAHYDQCDVSRETTTSMRDRLSSRCKWHSAALGPISLGHLVIGAKQSHGHLGDSAVREWVNLSPRWVRRHVDVSLDRRAVRRWT